jgi:transcriptional regulator
LPAAIGYSSHYWNNPCGEFGFMYIPPAFQGPGQDKLFDFIEANSFGLVVSDIAGVPSATHLPLLVRRGLGLHGQLVGHMARANPHWHHLAGAEVLVVFSGPHAYISPRWYEAENVVPTWNYVAVHAWGRCEILEDQQQATEVLADYVAHYERSMPTPWTIDTGTSFFRKLSEQIVAFRIDITRLEGKWKLSQNHAAERREKVARQLAQSTDGDAQEIARLMREDLSA